MNDETLRNAEDNASNTAEENAEGFYDGEKSGARGAVDAARSAAASQTMRAANAATGGKAGAALSAAKVVGKAKKFAPLLIVAAVIILAWGAFSFIGQWLFPFGFKARMSEDWNSTKTSAVARTDEMIDEQMACEENSEFSDTVYNSMGFSEEQKESFKNAGLDYKQDGCATVLTFKDADGTEKVVASDKKLSKYMNKGEDVADGGDAVSDSGAEGMTEDEAKAQILDDMQIAAETSNVLSFSQALQNPTFKQKYMSATKWYRGDTSGWYTDMTETVMERLGISRNNYNGFETTGNEEKDRQAFLDLAKSKAAAAEGSEIGDKSLMERVKDVADGSGTTACATSSAFNDVEGVISADQTARQVSAGSLWLEAIDKTMAGEGSAAPLSVANNIVVSSGGASAQGVTQLFGNGVVEQTNELVQKVSAQAHGNSSSILEKVESGKYRSCAYIGNTNEYNSEGFISMVGSAFKRAADWLKEKAKGFISALAALFNDGTITEEAEKALAETVAKYEEMKGQSYFNGEDTNLIGEALVSASERIYSEKAKSAGQVIGDETALLATYRANQDIIAENAEYDRATKSPLDITSKNTFLGSIAYSLASFATSSSSVSLTSAMQNVGSLISGSISGLLPTSQAISEAQVSRGDCVLSNNIGAVSNTHCNNYYNSDLGLASTDASKILNQVANLRYDNGGYVINSNVGAGGATYGVGPLNEAEKNISPSHWSKDGGHGCESDWVKKLDGTYDYSQPIAWRYSRYTNFEYEGYQSGWHNRTSSGAVGIEDAKNDVEPEMCVLDVKISEDKQPVINKNGALGVFLVASGQRGSEWGSADDSVLQVITKSDFTKGRLHPCFVDSDECNDEFYTGLGWNGDAELGSASEDFQEKTAKSAAMSRFIGGSAYLDFNNNLGRLSELGGINSDKRFKDPTRDNDYFWNEMKYYQAYTEMLEWMESAGVIGKSSATVAVNEYYDENPLDNSYEGIIARYSGMSKERVVAVLDLMEYVAFLNDYSPVSLYPSPALQSEELRYDNGEVVAKAEAILQSTSVIYADLRARTVVA
ncbi:hypothetical protein J6S39_01880 [Candidatus Saccharibacteria bacterium]|nr:hypothetical protein [Candidatus Saccharibacteria bacterium]